jgi:asparagine synthase (glutamine-hydrolysing)
LRLAYERWGQDCVHHLMGDWALAAWEVQEQRLFLARDHFGNTGLHYHQWQNGFAFASGIAGILALPEFVKKVNDQHLADQLILWFERDNTTVYPNLYRLSPAHTLTLERQQQRLHRYWKLEETPPLRMRSDAAYVEAFRELYRTAVHDRMRSNRPVASTLSAGLDSGAVTAFAAEVLRERGENLRAYTSVPIHQTHDLLRCSIDNEWDLASRTASFIGNIEHIALSAEHWTPLAGIRRTLEILHEPSAAVGNGYWIHNLLSDLAQNRYGVMLTGHCGNFATSFDGGVYRAWSALRQGQGQMVWRELASAAKMRQSWVRTILADVVKPAILTSQYAWQTLTRAKKSPFWAKESIISPILVHRLGLVEKTKHQMISDHLYLHSPRRQWLQILPYICTIGSNWHSLGAAYQLEVRDPTMDKRLLEFCFAIPQTQFVGDGKNRWLMRRAAQGLLPPEVQWERRRGLQGSDIGFRILADSNEVSQLLKTLEQSQLAMRYVNTKQIIDAWVRLNQESSNPLQADGYAVLGGLMVGMFLASMNLN